MTPVLSAYLLYCTRAIILRFSSSGGSLPIMRTLLHRLWNSLRKEFCHMLCFSSFCVASSSQHTHKKISRLTCHQFSVLSGDARSMDYVTDTARHARSESSTPATHRRGSTRKTFFEPLFWQKRKKGLTIGKRPSRNSDSCSRGRAIKRLTATVRHARCGSPPPR